MNATEKSLQEKEEFLKDIQHLRKTFGKIRKINKFRIPEFIL